MSYQQTLVMPFVMYWTVDSKHMQQFINNTQKCLSKFSAISELGNVLKVIWDLLAT
jgi:hypothetical protein